MRASHARRLPIPASGEHLLEPDLGLGLVVAHGGSVPCRYGVEHVLEISKVGQVLGQRRKVVEGGDAHALEEVATW